ncbi:MAG: RNA polymerase sigma factor [Tannerella sp.]|jgi:RNA polymerase sigma factor (sigma-70 family)|nr:RNA polymerase sigma factor [Tannerella sp.]
MDKQSRYDIDTLYKTYVNTLFSYALSLGFDRDTSMDAIHDVFCKLCLDEKLLKNVGNIRFYLLRALKNHLINIHKQRKIVTELSLGSFDRETEEVPFTINVTIEDELIEKEEDEEIRIRITRMLEKLSDRQRKIIYLRYTEGCEYEEISRLMHISVSSCRKLIHKAIVKLKKNVFLSLLN